MEMFLVVDEYQGGTGFDTDDLASISVDGGHDFH